MITSKQRAYLRKISHDTEPIFQIGKEGITDEFLKAAAQALNKREIIKIHVLESALLSAKEACAEVAGRLGAEQVQSIGNKFVIYRRSDDEKYRKIELKKR